MSSDLTDTPQSEQGERESTVRRYCRNCLESPHPGEPCDYDPDHLAEIERLKATFRADRNTGTYFELILTSALTPSGWRTFHSTKGEPPMTMFANRVEGTPYVKVSITYGPVSASVEEHHRHLRHFHTQLGQLLDQAEADD